MSRKSTRISKYTPYNYVFSVFTTLIGVGIVRFALVWLAWTQTHSYAWTGTISTIQLVPTIVLGLFFGTLSDRINPYRAQIFNMITVILLIISLIIFLKIDFINIYVVCFHIALLGIIAAAYIPLHIVILRTITSKDSFPKMVTLDMLGFSTATIIGPALGGYVLATFGFYFAFGFAIILGIHSIVVLWLLGKDFTLGTPSESGIFRDIKNLLNFVSNNKSVLKILLLSAIRGTLLSGMVQLLPVIAGGLFAKDADGAGVLMATSGVGAIMSTIVLLMLPDSSLIKKVSGLYTFLMIGLFALFIMASGPSWPGFIVASAILGFGATGESVVSQAATQLASPPDMQGKMASVWSISTIGGTAAGAFLFGLALDSFPATKVFVFALFTGVAAIMACGYFVRARPTSGGTNSPESP